MGFKGKIATLLLGRYGLSSDVPDVALEPGHLFSATNVSLRDNQIEKDYGSVKWNQSAMQAGVLSFIDFYPEEHLQRVYSMLSNGKVFRHTNPYVSPTEVTAVSPAPSTLVIGKYSSMLECGAEETNRDKKIFIFSSVNPVQVISGDSVTRSNISNPPADWTGINQPFKGIVYRGRVVAALGHNLYFSSATDHEDFTSSILTVSVYPGKGEKIIDYFTYKKRLFVLKYPTGLYLLDDSSTTVSDWRVDEINDSFGGASPFCAKTVIDDVVIANNYGTLTSMAAAFQLGDVASSDIINKSGLDKFFKDSFSRIGLNDRHCLYDSIQKINYVTFKSAGGTRKDRIVQMSIKGQTARFSMTTKDYPNCLGMIRDNLGIARPCYGANDGYIYRMDCEDRLAAGSAYTGEFWTHDLDFFAGDPANSENVKQFEHLEIVYLPTGNTTLTVDHYIDGRKQDSQTVQLKGEQSSELDNGIIGSTDPGLKMKTSAEVPFSVMIPAKGHGRRISVKCSNGEANRNFIIQKINVYYKDLDQKQVEK